MPGKLCFGTQFANAGAGRLSASHAFCEGLYWRSQGTAAAFPITDNPHAVGSEDADAWDRGWTVTDSAAGSTVDPTDAPCCAIPQNTIAA